MKKLVVILLIFAFVVGCKEKPVVEVKTKKLTCALREDSDIRGKYTYSYEYLEDELLSLEESYYVDSNDKDFQDYTKEEFKEFLDDEERHLKGYMEFLEQFVGIETFWVVDREKESAYYTVKVDYRNLIVPDNFEYDGYDLVSLVNSPLWKFHEEGIEGIMEWFSPQSYSRIQE